MIPEDVAWAVVVIIAFACVIKASLVTLEILAEARDDQERIGDE